MNKSPQLRPLKSAKHENIDSSPDKKVQSHLLPKTPHLLATPFKQSPRAQFKAHMPEDAAFNLKSNMRYTNSKKSNLANNSNLLVRTLVMDGNYFITQAGKVDGENVMQHTNSWKTAIAKSTKGRPGSQYAYSSGGPGVQDLF